MSLNLDINISSQHNVTDSDQGDGIRREKLGKRRKNFGTEAGKDNNTDKRDKNYKFYKQVCRYGGSFDFFLHSIIILLWNRAVEK